MIGIIAKTTKTVIKAVSLILMYKAPLNLAISLLIYNIVMQALYWPFLRLYIIKSSILGIGK